MSEKQDTFQETSAAGGFATSDLAYNAHYQQAQVLGPRINLMDWQKVPFLLPQRPGRGRRL